MLDPPALHSHMSHIWLPLIRRFTYTPQGMFVHIAPQCDLLELRKENGRLKQKLESRPACVRVTHIANCH